MKTFTRRFLAVAVSLTMTAAFSATAFASDITASQEQTQDYIYESPTEPMAVDANIITASAHRAASPVLGIMGLNATSGFGMINGGAPEDLATAQKSAAMGVWGSSLNDNPDPYYWNYFYNFYAAENGLELSQDILAGIYAPDTAFPPSKGRADQQAVRHRLGGRRGDMTPWRAGPDDRDHGAPPARKSRASR